MSNVTLANDNALVMVDDDKMEFMIMKHYVKRSKLKNELLPFSSGEQFLSYLDLVEKKEMPMPALALIDVRMPVMDGFELLQCIRRNQAFTTLPLLIMFSNSDNEADIKRANEVGANYYKVKPQNGEEYIAFLNSLQVCASRLSRPEQLIDLS